MPNPERKQLHGATITLGTNTTFLMTIIGFDEPERSSIEIADQDLASLVAKSFSSAVVDEGELSLTCRHTPGTIDPRLLVGGADETVTITYPLLTGEAVAANYTFTGHITKAGGVKGANDNRVERTVTFKVNSKPVFAAAS